jgi:hypothetical protein
MLNLHLKGYKNKKINMKNFNQKNNLESEIDEQRIGASITKEIENIATLRGSALEGAFRDMETAIGLKNNPILLKDVKTGGVAELRTADEIFAALKDGKLTGKELGRVEKGLLKSAETSPGLRKSISIDFAKDKNVLGELAKNNRNTTAEIKEYLKGKGYPPESINEIVAQMKANGAIDAKGLLVKNAGKVANTSGKVASKKFGTRIKELLTNIKVKKMSWKRLLLWGASLSIGGYALWYLIKQNSDVIPDGMPTTPPNPKDDWGPCLNYMIKNMGARIKQSPTQGIVVTTVPNGEYPGGIQFYPNGRMVNLQTKDMGTWKCVGGQAQTNENDGKTMMNESVGQIVKRVLNERFLMEQSNSQIDNDVEDMIDYLDFPVYGNDYVNIYNLLKKYGANGKYKEFAEQYNDSGFAKTSLRSDINSIYTIDAAPTRMKKQILALLDQIESGKVLPSTSTSNTKTGSTGFKMTTLKEQELQMSWDKDRKPGGGDGNSGGGGSTTTRKTYYDCTNVNIETTPLTYGCKSSKIGEIQKCLGVSVDNKFGPNTRKALIDNAYDMSKGITKEIYTKVLSACNPTSSSTEGGADVKYLRTPIKLDLGDVPQMPTKKTSGSSNSSGMTDAQFYQSFVDSGLITRNLIGRIVYKGQVLEPEEKSKLDNQMATMGYVPTREAATDEGERYVWKRA